MEKVLIRSPFARMAIISVGGIGIVAGFFFGTLLILDSIDAASRDAIRAQHAKILKAALERYRATHGAYPSPFPDNSADDLKSALVDGGYG
jgi:hypothetical protein